MSDAMKRRLPLLILGIAAVIAAAVLLLAPSPETREAREVVPIVRTLTVQPQAVTLTVEAHGTVVPRTSTTLVAQVAGEIVQTGPRFANGALVDPGEILVRIDARDYQLALTRAEVALAQAQLALEVEQARSQVAREEWADLGKGEPSPLAAREPQIAEARAAVDAAEAALEQARLNLERTRIRAPFRARVRAKLADLGRYANPGTPVAELVGTDVAEIRLPLPQRDLAFLDADAARAGDLSIPLRLSMDGRGEWQGEIVRSSGEFDPRTRMMTLTGVVDDPLALEREGEPLPFGAFVTGSISGRSVDGVFILPRGALREGDRVLVLEEGDRLRFRSVDLLRAENDRVLIRGGLEAGEQVCVSALEAPVDGMRVEVEGGAAEHRDSADERESQDVLP